MAFRKIFLTKNVQILILVKAPKCDIGSVSLKELFPEQNAIMLQNPCDISRLYWVAHRIRSHYNMVFYDKILHTTLQWLSLNMADILRHWCSLYCSLAITHWNRNIVIWVEFLSSTLPEIVILMTNSGATNDRIFIQIVVFQFDSRVV